MPRPDAVGSGEFLVSSQTYRSGLPRCRVLLPERLTVSCEASGSWPHPTDMMRPMGPTAHAGVGPSGVGRWPGSSLGPAPVTLTVRHSQACQLPPASPGVGWSMPGGAGGGKQHAVGTINLVQRQQGLRLHHARVRQRHVRPHQRHPRRWLARRRPKPSSSTSPRAPRSPSRQRAPGRHPVVTPPCRTTGSWWGQLCVAHKTSACCKRPIRRLNRRSWEPTPATGGLPGRPPGPSIRTGSHWEPVERTSGLSEQHAASASRRPVPPSWEAPAVMRSVLTEARVTDRSRGRSRFRCPAGRPPHAPVRCRSRAPRGSGPWRGGRGPCGRRSRSGR
jgi:hypothetical protein